MLNSGDRLRALFVIWGAATAIVISMMIFLGHAEGWVTAVLGLAVAFMTVLATFMVTRASSMVETKMDTGRMSGKAKRSDTALIDRLLDSMSDAEVAALRRRLEEEADSVVGDDGEMVSLDDLRAGRTPGGRGSTR
jgi:hypothetical protein